MSKQQILVVQGPTASGKTSLAIELAQHYHTEIISFDSRQFYQELKIGVARPSVQELAQVKHYLIGTHSINKPLNAATFADQAKIIMQRVLESKGSVVLVGGSALFADALLLGLDPLPHDSRVHSKWQAIFQKDGLRALQSALKDRDPEFFLIIDQMNPSRLVRALEVNELTGQSNLSLRKGLRKDPANVQRFYIEWPRQELYSRINRRVDVMIEEGLEQEAFSFYPKLMNCQALQTVGYREFFEFFEGKLSKAEAIDQIKQHSRNYAKRQLTWLSRYSAIHAISPGKPAEMLATALVKIG